jgi:hypothetical protein
MIVSSEFRKRKADLIIKSQGLKYIKPQFYNLQELEQDTPRVQASMLGTPIFSNLIIEDGSYQEDGKTTPTTFKGITIDTVLFDISQTKNIVKTPIQGRNGTVKEYISDGDYDINIRGILVSKENTYPEEEVNTLITICKVPAALKVASEFMQLFSIHSLVIESYDFYQIEGNRNMQGFNLRCLSDEPVELKIRE